MHAIHELGDGSMVAGTILTSGLRGPWTRAPPRRFLCGPFWVFDRGPGRWIEPSLDVSSELESPDSWSESEYDILSDRDTTQYTVHKSAIALRFPNSSKGHSLEYEFNLQNLGDVKHSGCNVKSLIN